MSQIIEGIRDRVAKRVTPTKRDRDEVHRLLDKFVAGARRKAKARQLRVKVEVEGSIAKDTWIGSDRDLDVFLIFPPGTQREFLSKEGLELAKASAGGRWRLGYAEHPYVEAEMEGFTLDIVPSIEMREGQKPVTSVDRTPLHTRFVREHLEAESRTEVRVLKQFLKGIKVYGAELRVGGFSGYLAELLVIHYGSFEEVVRAAAGWGERTLVDVSGQYGGKDLGEIFEGCLVVVDPIDMGRNAAAAVSNQSYFTLVAASRAFLKEPSVAYFFRKEGGVGADAVMKALAAKGTHVIALVTSCPQVPSDILWGEAYRSMRKVSSLLEEGDFAVNDMATWTDETDTLAFVFELQAVEIGRSKVHLGPRVSLPQESDRFLSKYRGGAKVLAGPYIRDDRWVVELERKETSARGLLAVGLKEIKLSRDVAAEISKGHDILEDEKLRGLLRREPALASFLLRFLRKRPPWMKH